MLVPSIALDVINREADQRPKAADDDEVFTRKEFL